MIKQTIFLTLAANFIWMLPAYQSAIKSRTKRIVVGRCRNTEEDYKLFLEKYPSVDADMYEKIWIGKEALFENPTHLEFYSYQEQNYFARKPFMCLYCITFWLGVITSVFFTILLFSVGSYMPTTTWSELLFEMPAAVVGAAVLSVALNRWFNSLPVKL